MLFIFKHDIFFDIKIIRFIGRYSVKKISGIGTSLGHTIYTYDFKKWFYEDGEITKKVSKTKKCIKCNCAKIDGKYDNCLGKIDGCISACCGHGLDDGYIYFSDGYTITAKEYKYLKNNKK